MSDDIVERLERMAATGIYPKEISEAAHEIERLRSRAVSEIIELQAKVIQLTEALQPFARNNQGGNELGHITREHLVTARRALGKLL